ncbi:MAG: 3-dehydroquinate synthase [Firmicutes bacterium]|nr:3-dehydroquinate synthase [Bacillota bacterium]
MEFEITAVQERKSLVLMGENWAERLSALGPRRVLVADRSVVQWAEEVQERVPVDDVLTLDISEAAKTLETLQTVYQWLGEHNVTRDVVVLALGGGVLTDLVGFAAATYLRGLRWVAVPTTLLAQVDAAIGGKVAVNTAFGKNFLGAFHLPELVVVDIRFLRSLPAREWRAGLGEVIKSALIRGGWLYETLGRLTFPTESDLSSWESVIAETARVKIDIVNQDLYETGPRMFLNFGHTVAHALENYLGYGAMTHGEAVGLGTLAALRLSERVLGLSPDVRDTVRGWLEAWQLPTRMPPLDFGAFWTTLHRDKKARAEGLTWVLLQAVGQPVLKKNLSQDIVRETLEFLTS